MKQQKLLHVIVVSNQALLHFLAAFFNFFDTLLVSSDHESNGCY